MVSWDHTIGLGCTFFEHPGIVTAIAVSFDGKFIFSGCQDNLVRKMTASHAKLCAVLPRMLSGATDVIVALSTQRAKNHLIAFSRSCDQCAYIASFDNLKIVARLSGHESLVWQTSFKADDSMILACCVRKSILLGSHILLSQGIPECRGGATLGSSVDEMLWTTAVFASLEHRSLLFCFNSARQMHILNSDDANAEESIIDIQMRANVFTASTFVGDTMVCGDDYGNVYPVRIA
ncbi:hypothetical protein JKF63_04184 [Porcisia hertigi]|uniref:Uncharacterized protein n=1 Tax=Porcisia hertigi TaxID=2761500 RepID=A0A836HZ70_9TRYP|nr:hypothetical protein JKF63_04184 [Porcisia hertigi]